MKDGKIMVSIDDLAKAMNKPYKYDTKTAAVYIGKQPSNSWCYLSDLKPLQWKGDFTSETFAK